MSGFETAIVVVAGGQRCQDRAKVIAAQDRTVIVVADGAGGSGEGHLAAETVVREVAARCASNHTTTDWMAELQAIDFRVSAGESTAVVVDIGAHGLRGASVGDSQAWILEDGNLLDLTAAQVRKPLLGSGEAQATGFSHQPFSGLLLVATDGFCNYVKRSELPRLLSRTPFDEIPRRCVELVRLPSGELWDDVAVVACRPRRPQRSRQKYSL